MGEGGGWSTVMETSGEGGGGGGTCLEEASFGRFFARKLSEMRELEGECGTAAVARLVLACIFQDAKRPRAKRSAKCDVVGYGRERLQNNWARDDWEQGKAGDAGGSVHSQSCS